MTKEYPLKAVLVCEGGVVHDHILPPGVQIDVKDYEIEGCDEGDLERDEKGDQFYRQTFTGKEYLSVELPVPTLPAAGGDRIAGVPDAMVGVQHDPHGVVLTLPVADEYWSVIVEKRPDGWRMFLFDDSSQHYCEMVLGIPGTHANVNHPQGHTLCVLGPN